MFVQGDQPQEIAEVVVPAGPVHLPAFIAEHIGGSRSEARRLLSQGAVRLDGEPLDGADLNVPGERLDGRVVQVGRRQFRRVRVAP